MKILLLILYSMFLCWRNFLFIKSCKKVSCVCRRPGKLQQGRGPVRPPAVGDVPGVRGPPAGDGQLLFELPRLLQRQPTVQGSSLQSVSLLVSSSDTSNRLVTKMIKCPIVTKDRFFLVWMLIHGWIKYIHASRLGK